MTTMKVPFESLKKITHISQAGVTKFVGISLILCAVIITKFSGHENSRVSQQPSSMANSHTSNQASRNSRNSRISSKAAGEKIATPCHLNYINHAQKGLTRSEVVTIIDEIQKLFPDQSTLHNHKTLRQYRELQIEAFTKMMTEGLQLSSSQQGTMYSSLSLIANQQFADFSSKYQLDKPDSGINHEGQKYFIVSGTDYSLLFKPSMWLAETNLEDLFEATENQLKILPIHPSDPPGMASRLDAITQNRIIIKDPLTSQTHLFENGKQINLPILGNILPLTPDQETKLNQLLSSEQETQASLTQQSQILTKEQLALSLLIYPDTIDKIKEELSLNL